MGIKDIASCPYIPKVVVTIHLTPPSLKPFELHMRVTVIEADEHLSQVEAAPLLSPEYSLREFTGLQLRFSRETEGFWLQEAICLHSLRGTLMPWGRWLKKVLFLPPSGFQIFRRSRIPGQKL